MRPIVEDVADEFTERVTTDEIGQPDADEAARWKVRGTPTLIAVRDGEEVGRLVGSASTNDVRKLYTAAATGIGSKTSITSQDRILRTGAGAALAIWGVLASTPLLVAIGGAAILFGTYDLLLPGRR